MRRRGFTLIEIMVVVGIVGLLAAMAAMSFIRFMTRARQAEARTNLKAIYTAEKAYYGNQQAFIDFFDVIGFEPEMNNRYAYFAGQAGGTETRIAACGSPTSTSLAGGSGCAGLTGVSVITLDMCKWGTPPTVPGSADAICVFIDTNNNLIAANPIAGVGPGGNCCPGGACEFTASAEGNADNDPTLDAWIIASDGTGANGCADTCVGATGPVAGLTGTGAEGEPLNVCDDAAF